MPARAKGQQGPKTSCDQAVRFTTVEICRTQQTIGVKQWEKIIHDKIQLWLFFVVPSPRFSDLLSYLLIYKHFGADTHIRVRGKA